MLLVGAPPLLPSLEGKTVPEGKKSNERRMNGWGGKREEGKKEVTPELEHPCSTPGFPIRMLCGDPFVC